MSKSKISYICNNCGAVAHKWSGRCADCGKWNTLSQEKEDLSIISISSGKAIELDSNVYENIQESKRIPSSFSEIDHILGGGIVEGGAMLLGGDPGIGKSTILLQLSIALANAGNNVLYITGEESCQQVMLRAKRLDMKISKSFKIAAATNAADIIATLRNNPGIKILIIDSVQTMSDPEISSAPGTVSQIRSVANSLISYCKGHFISLFLIGHITKDGQIAGPKVLEHMVDVVLYFEGDQNYYYRIIRSIKNRFGPVNESAIFEMTSGGLNQVTNPSALFLNCNRQEISGSVTFACIEGTRPVLVEVQMLVMSTSSPMPRRAVVGWDSNRLAMILAVLAVRYGLNLSAYEVYLTVAGGFKISEPAADLAIAAGLISAATQKIIPSDVVFFGELGLSGEVRKVQQPAMRLKEARKLGFDRIIASEDIEGITKVTHISQLRDILFV